MCVQVRNVVTSEEVDSPSGLRRMLGSTDLVLQPSFTDLAEDCCLCQVDVAATVARAGWQYKEISGDPMDVEITPPSS